MKSFCGKVCFWEWEKTWIPWLFFGEFKVLYLVISNSILSLLHDKIDDLYKIETANTSTRLY